MIDMHTSTRYISTMYTYIYVNDSLILLIILRCHVMSLTTSILVHSCECTSDRLFPCRLTWCMTDLWRLLDYSSKPGGHPGSPSPCPCAGERAPAMPDPDQDG